MYKGHPFVYRSVADIKADIDTVKVMVDEIREVSRKIGQEGQINREVLQRSFERQSLSERESLFFHRIQLALFRRENGISCRMPTV